MDDLGFLDAFSRTFASARDKFRQACRHAAVTQDFIHPEAGPGGEELATSLAYFGARDAPFLIVSVSGTHGVEGWAGSACQIAWARSGAAASLPDNVAVLHLHAINPWGMAWDRRQQEDNVDLNRHYVDFRQPPDDRQYAKLHAHVMCAGNDPNRRRIADAALRAYRVEHGPLRYAMALQGGQYSFPEGPAYGGCRPSWSRGVIDDVLARHCARARRIVVFDMHTGYGPYGYGTPLWHMGPGPSFDRARLIFGPTLEAPLTGDRADQEFIQHGHFYRYCEERLPHAEVIAMCFEFGGEWLAEGERARLEREDALLWRDDDRRSQASRQARRRWRDLHCPDRDDWREMVWMRGRQVFREMVERVPLDDGPSVLETM